MDEELLKWYIKGFHDELWSGVTPESDIELENKAYKLGRIHAIVGDDCRSVDYLTDEEILDLIKT